MRGDIDPDIACYIVVGGLEIIVTALVLDVIEIGDRQSEEDFYAKAVRTVVEIFCRGLAAEGRRG